MTDPANGMVAAFALANQDRKNPMIHGESELELTRKGPKQCCLDVPTLHFARLELKDLIVVSNLKTKII